MQRETTAKVYDNINVGRETLQILPVKNICREAKKKKSENTSESKEHRRCENKENIYVYFQDNLIFFIKL